MLHIRDVWSEITRSSDKPGGSHLCMRQLMPSWAPLTLISCTVDAHFRKNGKLKKSLSLFLSLSFTQVIVPKSLSNKSP